MKFFFALITLAITACQPNVNNRGNTVFFTEMKNFKIGETTTEEVIEACGTPSIKKNAKTWIYVGSVSEEISFQKIKLKNKYVLRISFDDKNKLKSIDNITPKDNHIICEKEYTKLINQEKKK